MLIQSNLFDDTSYNSHFSHWKFELSDFQKWAIKGIVDEKNVIITAHTGSGKTLPAEFAIQHFFSKGKKVVYTTPIKALSNEKFNDLQNKYPDISFGILTGDIKFNPEADVIIMTTEILYNTLFQKKMLKEDIIKPEQLSLHFEMDIENELGCVVFDEIHYINDPDRGRIWEETIMLLPKSTQIVGLSATIDKPDRFCQWIENISLRESWLCSYDKRIVPLTHHSFITFPDSYYKKFPIEIKNLIDDNHFKNKPIVLKQQGKLFKEKTYQKISKLLNFFDKERIRINQFFVMNKMVEYLNQNNLLPALCFIFSRKQTKIFAEKITIPLFPQNSTIPSTIKKECKQILMRLPNYREYIVLPEYEWITRLLEKGIAVHHSGIAPVFREMVEILFGKGYIKLLFATETFAVGINMPTKSVIFSSLSKFDGKGFRLVKGHEYTQMAGRAGRRGKDIKGHIFHLNNLFRDNQRPSSHEMNVMMGGKPETLSSKFKINFSMLLKMIASKQFDFKSFAQNSMLSDVIQKNKKYIDNEINHMDEIVNKFSFEFLKTGKESLERYHFLKTKQRVVRESSKNRKKTAQEMRLIEENSKTFKDDFKKYEIFIENCGKLKNLKETSYSIEHSIENEIKPHIKILQKNEFITVGENEGEYELTEMGKMASNVNEIHYLAISDIIFNQNAFIGLSVTELTSVLSVFCDIRLSDENRIFSVDYVNTNDNVKKSVKMIKKAYDKYYDEETTYETNFMFKYELQYDLIEIVQKWANSEDAIACQNIIKEMEQWGIYIGNFTKAILKICNIAMELENVCLIQNNLELLKTLREVSDKLKKFIVTSQSLYL
uniref:Helicase n=1 Tax=viral metagenome TaxID=1070528 RepID=A0A6C0LWY7_9ZZZZ